MRCLRCGYCCVNHMVVIVDDPDKGVTEDNLRFKPTGERCQHLRGDKPGQYSCAVHDQPWYNGTPCSWHGQVEQQPSDACRIGEHIMERGDETVAAILGFEDDSAGAIT